MAYDNYRPEINYGEEGAIAENLDEQRGKANVKEEEKPSRRRRRNTQKEEPAKPIEKPKVEKGPSSFKKFKEWLVSPQSRVLAGIFVGCLAIYLAVSFCGYFSSCIQDQSKIASASIGQAVNISNPGGEGGARLSELLINEGFGLGSLVVIIWLGAISLKLLIGRPKFKTLDFTIKCFVALITVSLIIGLVTYNMHTQVNWGGYHGTYVNEAIIHFIGNIGAVLLSIFMLALFVVICLRDLVNWAIRKRRKRAERKRIEAEEKALRERKEEEIRRMQEQEMIDDLHAGETAEIHSVAGISDATEHVPAVGVDFENEDSLYEISDEIEDAENNSCEKPGDDSSFENQVEAGDENSEIIDEKASQTDSEVNNPSEGEGGKMVVNVNAIGQTTAKRFVPDVEAWEKHKYKFPPFELLRQGEGKINVDTEEQLENKRKIEKILLDFNIPILSIEATVGPTITLYEVVPQDGIATSKIRRLVDDIALRLSAVGVRIIAPIPGKGTVGIEVANKDPQTISMRTVIKSKKYQESKYILPMAIGSTISNEVYIADLAKMPHLLVAGATGQGKSVGLNAIIASLLYCKAPHEIKFVMIDPKQLEFSLYNKIKDHYMAAIPGDDDEPVITDMQKVEATLNSLCIEMDNRYTLMKNAHVRNIEEYNAKIREGRLNPAEGHKFFPYIVVVVDEFADLIVQAGKNVEMPIARLAQKARAAGIHVILATQRPSTNVITGLIKSNFPARMAFKVTSAIDSKIILDTTGAQSLIGRGDMLIFHNSEMMRVQCAFIDTPEVEAICDYVSRQPYPQGVYALPEPAAEGGGTSGDTRVIGDRDPLLFEVARAVVSSGRASTSNVQRHYELGYNRAGRIMDQLEKLGIVGPAQGGKPRVVLVDPMRLEEILAGLE